MTSSINIKQLDQSAWSCYQLTPSTYYYGQVGYLDESGIVHPKDNQQASTNPKNKLVKHGFGIYLTNISQDGIPQTKYQGYWDKDQKSGKGSVKLEDGTTYDGSFHEGHYHGSGRMVWANGDQYDGNWKRSKMDGSGVFKHSTGFVLKGLFKTNYFIDDNILRNPFLSDKEYAVFKKERKEILKQKEKQQKLKHGFTTKIPVSQVSSLKQAIDKSASNNRVPLILSTKTTPLTLQTLTQSLQSNSPDTPIHIFDLRKLYTLQEQEKWSYRRLVHERFRNSLRDGAIFILSLDESSEIQEFGEMFYPDVKEFYDPNGFSQLAWSREQLGQPDVKRRLLGGDGDWEWDISQGFRFAVWTKFKVDGKLTEDQIRDKLQNRFEKIIPFIKIDCIVLGENSN